jgi:hypothetical protein
VPLREQVAGMAAAAVLQLDVQVQVAAVPQTFV